MSQLPGDRIKWPTDTSDLGTVMLVTADVETSDQMGKSQLIPVGVFTDMVKMRDAVFAADAKYRANRINFYFQRVQVDRPMGMPSDPTRYWAFMAGTK